MARDPMSNDEPRDKSERNDPMREGGDMGRDRADDRGVGAEEEADELDDMDEEDDEEEEDVES